MRDPNAASNPAASREQRSGAGAWTGWHPSVRARSPQQPEASNHAGGYVSSLLGLKGANSVSIIEEHGGEPDAGTSTPPALRGDLRPTYDQMYLAEKLNEVAPQGHLSWRAVQNLNSDFGVRKVSDSMRLAHGFAPPGMRSAYAYVRKLCSEQP